MLRALPPAPHVELGWEKGGSVLSVVPNVTVAKPIRQPGSSNVAHFPSRCGARWKMQSPALTSLGLFLVFFCWHRCVVLLKNPKSPCHHYCMTSSARWPISRWGVLDQHYPPTSIGLAKLVSPWGFHRVTMAMLLLGSHGNRNYQSCIEW